MSDEFTQNVHLTVGMRFSHQPGADVDPNDVAVRA
jgi:hypothetical protein